MSNRTPLQHLLRSLLPTGRPPEAATPVQDFEETRPDPAPPPGRRDGRRASLDKSPSDVARAPVAWAESSIELAQGSEIVELPDDSVADVMDRFFPAPDRRAS